MKVNWIGIKHLVLYRIEQFLFLFIPCRHSYDLYMDKTEQEDMKEILQPEVLSATMSWTVHCRKCDKPAKLYIGKQIDPSMINLDLTGKHKCKYCGAMTSQPDEDCYMAPDK